MNYFQKQLGDIKYVARRILTGEPFERSNRNFWELHAKNPQSREGGNFHCYTPNFVNEHLKIVSPLLKDRELTLLDVGCGNGQALELYRKQLGSKFGEGYGIDVSPSILKCAKEKFPQFSFLEYDILSNSKIPEMISGKCDFIFCWSNLHCFPKRCLPNIAKTFRAFAKKDGILLLGWWSTFYVEQFFSVPTAPASYKHSRKTVLDALAPFFNEVDTAAYRKAYAEEKLSLPQNWFHKVFRPFHPKEVGFLVSRAK